MNTFIKTLLAIAILTACMYGACLYGVDKGRNDVASGEYTCIKKPSKGLDYECKEVLSSLFWGIENPRN